MSSMSRLEETLAIIKEKERLIIDYAVKELRKKGVINIENREVLEKYKVLTTIVNNGSKTFNISSEKELEGIEKYVEYVIISTDGRVLLKFKPWVESEEPKFFMFSEVKKTMEETKEKRIKYLEEKFGALSELLKKAVKEVKKSMLFGGKSDFKEIQEESEKIKEELRKHGIYINENIMTYYPEVVQVVKKYFGDYVSDVKIVHGEEMVYVIVFEDDLEMLTFDGEVIKEVAEYELRKLKDLLK